MGKQFFAVLLVAAPLFATSDSEPRPVGRLVDLGGHRLHVKCTGRGNPTVVVEKGLGDFSFDWVLVQSGVSRFTRICTYDRAGYAWSDPGPKPRTFGQLNLELRDALSRLGEHGPYVLVGHSYGGPVVRNFALAYPAEVAGIILVDSAFENQRVGIGGKATMRLGDGAKGVPIPPPHEQMKESDRPPVRANSTPPAPPGLDSMYDVLPPDQRKLQLWAQSRPELEDAENSQREWSGEYFAKWLAAPQAGTLGAIPLIVLTRADGGYREGEADVSSAQLERERKEGQAKLATLSTSGRQVYLHSGHNMELEAPDEVSAAIREMIVAVRRRRP
jgi:pimeloyl-ACP methyl ester carboxylesterase